MESGAPAMPLLLQFLRDCPKLNQQKALRRFRWRPTGFGDAGFRRRRADCHRGSQSAGRSPASDWAAETETSECCLRRWEAESVHARLRSWQRLFPGKAADRATFGPLDTRHPTVPERSWVLAFEARHQGDRGRLRILAIADVAQPAPSPILAFGLEPAENQSTLALLSEWCSTLS